MRMSEASARMHLRDNVREDDVDLAIKVITCLYMQCNDIPCYSILCKLSHTMNLKSSFFYFHFHFSYFCLHFVSYLGHAWIVFASSESVRKEDFAAFVPSLRNVRRRKQSVDNASIAEPHHWSGEIQNGKQHKDPHFYS